MVRFTPKFHDGSKWSATKDLKYFDGTEWVKPRAAYIRVDGEWANFYTNDPPMPVLEKPGRVPTARLTQVNQDGQVFIKAEWDSPPTGGKAESYTIRWGHAKGSWIDGGESHVRTKLILVENPLWDHEVGPKYQLRVRARNASGAADSESPDAWITLVRPDEPKPAGTLPAPKNVKLERNKPAWNRWQVSWDAVPGAAEYEVHWTSNKGPTGVKKTPETTYAYTNSEGPELQWDESITAIIAAVDSSGVLGDFSLPQEAA
ncbi:hypothetical protein ACFYVL_33560 [Streptomyces sp. NPDC004111]|uniref:hypothetical protein n=1 Tax=Streptomyces sp. NPDC004111 TaxID=3364690 RepID=UPI00369DF883